MPQDRPKRAAVVPVSAAAETYHIPTKGKVDAVFGAMVYLAVLAYPESKEESWNKRDKFISHMKGWWAKQQKKNPTLRKELPPKYTDIRPRDISNVLNLAFRRTDKSLVAAEFAWHLYRSKEPREIAELWARLTGVAAATIASLHKHFELQLPEKLDLDTFRHEIWVAALPVLHLAMVWPRNLDLERPEFGKHKNPLNLVCHPEWLEQALVRAEELRLELGERIQSTTSYKPEHAIRLLIPTS